MTLKQPHVLVVALIPLAAIACSDAASDGDAENVVRQLRHASADGGVPSEPPPSPVIIFGPRSFVRGKGKPHDEVVPFDLPDCAHGPFTIEIDPPHGVNAAIRLNGRALFQPGDSKRRCHRTSEVTLEPHNELVVETRGNPGSSLKISILAAGLDAPSVCTIMRTIGPAGGEIGHPADIGVVAQPGTLTTDTQVSIAPEPTSEFVSEGLPAEFAVVGSVRLTLSALPSAPLALFIGAPAVVDDRAFFVAKLIDSGGERRLSVVDTASIKGGRLTTNSPPFPGVLEAGSYAFFAVPQGTALAMFHVADRAGVPTAGARVEMSGAASPFIGISAPDGFASMPVQPGASASEAVALALNAQVGVMGAYAPIGPGQAVTLPIPTPIPTLPNAFVQFIMQQLGVLPSQLPPRGQPCGISAVRVDPRRIDDPANPFRVGDARPLKVECTDTATGAISSCARSTDGTGILRMPLTGFSFHFTSYQVNGNPPPVALSAAGPLQILAVHQGTGNIRIAVQKTCLRRVDIGGNSFVVTQPSPLAAATVDPIVVECAAGTVICGGSCVSEACGGGQMFDFGTCACVCPAATVMCGGSCMSNVCSGGQLFDSGSCTCICPAGSVFCNGSCVSDACSGGQVFDQSSCSCVCPAGTVSCGGQCVADVCAADQVFDPASCTCISTGIAVLSASYGNGSCGNPFGNVTGIVANQCNGTSSCQVFVHNGVFGDPSYGCAKDFSAEYRCGIDPGMRTASHGAVAGEGYTVDLNCP